MSKKRVLLLGCLLLFILPGFAGAEEVSVRPGINDYYRNPDYGYWVRVFESPGRELYDRQREVVAALGLEHGMDVADVGAGTGLFTRLIAAAVAPEGQVFAVDIASGFVENTVRRAHQQGLQNVTGVVNSATSVMLADASIDLAFLCDTYHHFEYPRAMLESIHRALRSDGELVIVDFRKQAGVSSNWVMGHVRADRNEVIAEVEAAGFLLVEQPAILRRNYFLRFIKS